jgi:hypothetical protein
VFAVTVTVVEPLFEPLVGETLIQVWLSETVQLVFDVIETV